MQSRLYASTLYNLFQSSRFRFFSPATEVPKHQCTDIMEVPLHELYVLKTYMLLLLHGVMLRLTRAQFNIGTELFIRDWRTAELILSVRDLRMHEHDPLVGIVVLPLADIFKQRSQINDYFPLSGGIGKSSFMRGAYVLLNNCCRSWPCSYLDGVSANTATSTQRTPGLGIRHSPDYV
jgi:hypothetical protein